MLELRNYYAQRHGGPPLKGDIVDLRAVLRAKIHRLEQEGYFQWHLGFTCVDDGYIDGHSSGSDLRAYVQWELGDAMLWPFERSLRWLDQDGLFSVLEFLHDHSASPIASHFHEFGNCGIHVQSADDVAGREVFRTGINRYLRQYRSGFEMQDNGEIWSTSPTGLQDRQPYQTGRNEIDTRVQHAISAFRRHNASDEDKRDAIRNLADVLEHLRAEVDGTGLPGKDEDRLFEIANSFSIRHHNPNQRTGYDAGVWLDWIYYAFLNSVSLVTELVTRVSTTQTSSVDAGDLPFP